MPKGNIASISEGVSVTANASKFNANAARPSGKSPASGDHLRRKLAFGVFYQNGMWPVYRNFWQTVTITESLRPPCVDTFTVDRCRAHIEPGSG